MGIKAALQHFRTTNEEIFHLGIIYFSLALVALVNLKHWNIRKKIAVLAFSLIFSSHGVNLNF